MRSTADSPHVLERVGDRVRAEPERFGMPDAHVVLERLATPAAPAPWGGLSGATAGRPCVRWLQIDECAVQRQPSNSLRFDWQAFLLIEELERHESLAQLDFYFRSDLSP